MKVQALATDPVRGSGVRCAALLLEVENEEEVKLT